MNAQFSIPLRTTGTAYLWWLLLGGIGAHKFYLGRPLVGVMYALTLGFLGIGLLLDLFSLPSQVRVANSKLVSEAEQLAGNSPSGTSSSSRGGFAHAPISGGRILVASVLGLVVVVAIGGTAGDRRRARASESRTSASVASVPSAATGSTGQSVVRELLAQGFEDGLSGRGWSASRAGQGWLAILHKRRLGNEVSVLLESDHGRGSVHTEVAAEVYDAAHSVPTIKTWLVTLRSLDTSLTTADVDRFVADGGGELGGWAVVREDYPQEGFELRAVRLL